MFTPAAARRATGLDPRVPGGWLVLGKALYRSGDLRAAAEALEKAREQVRGEETDVLFFLAMTRRRLGEEAEARRWFDQAVARLEKYDGPDPRKLQLRAEAAALLNVTAKPGP